MARGKRYTKPFEASIPSQVVGATVTHAAKQMQTPAATVERVYKRWMDTESPHVQVVCKQQASESKKLVLGMDDFSIRKGHTYNTGLHDLRNGTLLDIL